MKAKEAEIDLAGYEALCFEKCDHCADVYNLYMRKANYICAARITSKAAAFKLLDTIRKVGTMSDANFIRLGRDVATSTMPEFPPEALRSKYITTAHSKPEFDRQMRRNLQTLLIADIYH